MITFIYKYKYYYNIYIIMCNNQLINKLFFSLKIFMKFVMIQSQL